MTEKRLDTKSAECEGLDEQHQTSFAQYEQKAEEKKQRTKQLRVLQIELSKLPRSESIAMRDLVRPFPSSPLSRHLLLLRPSSPLLSRHLLLPSLLPSLLLSPLVRIILCCSSPRVFSGPHLITLVTVNSSLSCLIVCLLLPAASPALN